MQFLAASVMIVTASRKDSNASTKHFWDKMEGTLECQQWMT